MRHVTNSDWRWQRTIHKRNSHQPWIQETLYWRHNERDGVSIVCLGANQRKYQNSASLAFVRGTPHTKASNAKNVSIWWRHHVGTTCVMWFWSLTTSLEYLMTYNIRAQSPSLDGTYNILSNFFVTCHESLGYAHFVPDWCVASPFANTFVLHDDVIKWKHFPRYWPFVRGIHRSPVNSPHKGQWRGALMFSLIYAWINSWINNRETGDLRRHRAHYDVIVMY